MDFIQVVVKKDAGHFSDVAKFVVSEPVFEPTIHDIEFFDRIGIARLVADLAHNGEADQIDGSFLGVETLDAQTPWLPLARCG